MLGQGKKSKWLGNCRKGRGVGHRLGKRSLAPRGGYPTGLIRKKKQRHVSGGNVGDGIEEGVAEGGPPIWRKQGFKKADSCNQVTQEKPRGDVFGKMG